MFKATEQITKYTQSCLEIMRKHAPKMKEKAFLSILNQNFPGGACPQKLGPYGPKKFYPLGVTPVTATAMVVQNSIENPTVMPSMEQSLYLHVLKTHTTCIIFL